MKIELVPHTGIRYDDAVVEFNQWQVFATGSDEQRVLVGYLPHDPNVALMMLCNQPMNVLSEIVSKCEAITGRKVLPPVDIVVPPEIDNTQGEDEDEEELEDE